MCLKAKKATCRFASCSGADRKGAVLSSYPDPLAPEAIEAYFRLFYWSQKDNWDKHKVMEKMTFDYCSRTRSSAVP